MLRVLRLLHGFGAVRWPQLERCDVQLHAGDIRSGLVPVDCGSLVPRLDLRTLPQFLLLFPELGSR